MTSIVYSKHFLRSSRRLPQRTQKKLARKLEILRQNPFHSLLRTKALGGKLLGFYSFRITRDYRVIFQFKEQNVVKLIEVGHRKEIYK